MNLFFSFLLLTVVSLSDPCKKIIIYLSIQVFAYRSIRNKNYGVIGRTTRNQAFLSTCQVIYFLYRCLRFYTFFVFQLVLIVAYNLRLFVLELEAKKI